MKSIHFTQIPNMFGKKTIKFADEYVINFKDRKMDKILQQEIEEYFRGYKDIDNGLRMGKNRS